MKEIINNNSTGFEIYGNPQNPPIVLIHGFPFSRKMWEPQIAPLSTAYQVITYDVRGHGQSDAGDGQFTIELFVDDLIALLDYLHLPRVTLLGLSMGGYIALRAIERHPDRFKALILCDTKSEADADENKIKRGQQVQAIKTKGLQSFAEGFLKAVFYEASFQKKPEAINRIRSIILSNPPLGVTGTLIALAARTDTTPSLSSIRVPTLVLVGEHDAITPPYASRTMKEHISNSELHIIPEAAHMSNLENTEEFNRHLIAFLSKLG